MFDYKANKPLLCDAGGRRLTTGLFEELQAADTVSKPVFKLSDWREVYLKVGDPTDYKAAMELIGDWDHWQLLANNPVFKAHLDEWRKEVIAAIKSEAIQTLIKHSKGINGTSAAKYLAEHGYVEKPKKSRQTKKTDTDDETSDDFKRLGLRSVK